MWVRLKDETEAQRVLARCEDDPPLKKLSDRVRTAIADAADEAMTKARERAEEEYVSEEIEIDEDCAFSRGERGTWVQAWLWVAGPPLRKTEADAG